MKTLLSGVTALLLCAAVAVPGQARAFGLDLALSNQTAQLALLLNPHSINYLNGAEMSVGGYFTEDRGNVAQLALTARSYTSGSSSLYKLGAGVKAVYGDIQLIDELAAAADDDEPTVGALALGFEAVWLLVEGPRLEFSLDGYFAPSITSYSGTEQFMEGAARLQFEVTPRAFGYLGYRRMRFDTEEIDDLDLDSGWHLGLKIT